MLLGWAPKGDREIVTMDEIINEFRLDDVVPSPAFFDEKKLLHFNGEHIRALAPSEFIDRVVDYVRGAGFDAMGPLIQERSATLAESINMVDFFYVDQPSID